MINMDDYNNGFKQDYFIKMMVWNFVIALEKRTFVCNNPLVEQQFLIEIQQSCDIKGIWTFLILNIYRKYFLSNMLIIRILLLLSLIDLVASQCLNPQQLPGSCTKCSSTQILLQGNCYRKMRGCLKYAAGPVCTLCQNGYVLSQNKCIREAIYLGLTTNQVPPVAIYQPEKLKAQDIKDKIAEKYGSTFAEAHQQLLKREPSINGTTIESVSTLSMKTGAIITVSYTDIFNKIKQYVLIVNSLNQVTSVEKIVYGEESEDPITAAETIQSMLKDNLKNYFLYQFKQNGNNYLFDYLNDHKQVIRVQVNKKDIALDLQLLQQKINVQNLYISDLAKEAIIQKYPYLGNKTVTKVEEPVHGIYILYFGQEQSVSVQFSNYRFIINSPVFVPKKTINQSDSVVGGFRPFNNLEDLRYKLAVDQAIEQFPELEGKYVEKVLGQIVAGINFLIYFSGYEEISYQVKIYVDLKNQTRLLQAYKDGEPIYSEVHNYNNDAIFLQHYPIAVKQSKILNIPPIRSVTRKVTGDLYSYEVIYSEDQTFRFVYDLPTEQLQIVGYFIDGENILELITPELIKKSVERSQSVLFEALKEKRPQFSNGRVIKFVATPPSYYLEVVTWEGRFDVWIHDRKGKIIVGDVNKTSNKTCFNYLPQNFTSTRKIVQINAFLKESFNLEDSRLQLAQEDVRQDHFMLRFLYADGWLKQTVIYMEQVGPTVTLVRASLMNLGYGVLNPDPRDLKYTKILNYLNNIEVQGRGIPFYSEYNGTHLRAFYNDGKSTIEYVIDEKTGYGQNFIITSRKYSIVPTGFSLENLLIPGNPSQEDENILHQIQTLGKSKFSNYLSDSVIAFADKTDNIYRLMFKSASYGYVKTEALVLSSGTILINNLFLTKFSDEDFSSCRLFSKRGRCLSCSENQIQYQGECFDKLEGCLIQPGEICVKCDSNYVRSNNYRCYGSCEVFFEGI